MIKRIIDKQTKLFIRDDFDFDEETEIGLEVEPAQGLFRPRWDGEITEDEEGNVLIGDGEWVEDMTAEEIEALKAQAEPQEPTLEERVAEHDTKIVTLEETIVVLYGGV